MVSPRWLELAEEISEKAARSGKGVRTIGRAFDIGRTSGVGIGRRVLGNGRATTALFGAAMAGGIITGATKGFRGDGEIHRQFMDLTLGDPDADQSILGTRLTMKNIIAFNTMPFPQVTSRIGIGTYWPHNAGTGGGMVGGALGAAAGFAVGGPLGMGLGAGIGGTIGHIAGDLSVANVAYQQGFVNPATIGDYVKYPRNTMPRVPGDVVLGAYNMRHA